VAARQPSTRTKNPLEGSLLSLFFVGDSHRVRKSRTRAVESQESRVKSQQVLYFSTLDFSTKKDNTGAMGAGHKHERLRVSQSPFPAPPTLAGSQDCFVIPGFPPEGILM
jgi:hypothetical protein